MLLIFSASFLLNYNKINFVKLKLFLSFKNNNSEKEESYLIQTEGCKIRKLDPFDPEIMKTCVIRPYKPCLPFEEISYINYNKTTGIYTLSIKEDILKFNTNIKCNYQEIIRRHELKNDYGALVNFTKSINIPENVENIYVNCYVGGTRIYKNGYPLIQRKKKSGVAVKNPISVIIMGIDSLSRSSLIRNMPKTWEHLQSREYWFNLPGYNRVGMNTVPNLLPLLTGLKMINQNNPCRGRDEYGFNRCPIIWKTFQELGFATAYAEDSPYMTFNCNNNRGFKDPPTDHYMKPFYNFLETRMLVRDKGFCIHFKHGAEYVYDYMMDFAKVYKGQSPYFGLFWANTFTHDNPNLAFKMDEKIAQYLQDLEDTIGFDNTVIVFLSDHGLRFGAARLTKVGAFEENLPMFNIWIPSILRTPEILRNLEINSQRLVSTYDIHKTFLHLFNISGFNVTDNELSACPNCHSILKPISRTRTCFDAGIPSPYCSCNDYESTPSDSNVTVSTAQNVVSFMNDFKNSYNNGTFSGLCKNLTLGEIKYAYIFKGNNELEESLFVRFKTEPNNGHFEVKVLYPGNSSEPIVSEGTVTINRVNSYAKDSYCIQELRLVKMCYCG